jgi:hypothetical protein
VSLCLFEPLRCTVLPYEKPGTGSLSFVKQIGVDDTTPSFGPGV